MHLLKRCAGPRSHYFAVVDWSDPPVDRAFVVEVRITIPQEQKVASVWRPDRISGCSKMRLNWYRRSTVRRDDEDPTLSGRHEVPDVILGLLANPVRNPLPVGRELRPSSVSSQKSWFASVHRDSVNSASRAFRPVDDGLPVWREIGSIVIC